MSASLSAVRYSPRMFRYQTALACRWSQRGRGGRVEDEQVGQQQGPRRPHPGVPAVAGCRRGDEADRPVPVLFRPVGLVPDDGLGEPVQLHSLAGDPGQPQPDQPAQRRPEGERLAGRHRQQPSSGPSTASPDGWVNQDSGTGSGASTAQIRSSWTPAGSSAASRPVDIATAPANDRG